MSAVEHNGLVARQDLVEDRPGVSVRVVAGAGAGGTREVNQACRTIRKSSPRDAIEGIGVIDAVDFFTGWTVEDNGRGRSGQFSVVRRW